MKVHQVSKTEDGFANWIRVLDADPATGMIGIQFTSTWENGKNPDEHQVKHTIFLNRIQFTEMASFFMKEVLYV